MKLIVIELKVPWETRCQEAHKRKRVKYEDILSDFRQAGWQTWNFPVEVGARGFLSTPCGYMMASIGLHEGKNMELWPLQAMAQRELILVNRRAQA